VAARKRGQRRSPGCAGRRADRSDVRLIEGDSVTVLDEMEPESVDAIVTDPPYGLEFMGADWDRLGAGKPRSGAAGAAMEDWHRRWAEPALRVLRPGGHLLAFGGTRTYHRLTCALEAAGFEIRDSIVWLYGSGFPKSLDVSKAIDKKKRKKREVVGRAKGAATANTESLGRFEAEYDKTRPATLEAERWEGWGTALKPAHEPVVVARKPLIGNVAENVLDHGTGAINVDACRIGIGRAAGRWPANVVFSHLEDCEQIRTTTVKSDGHFPASRGVGGLSTDGHSGQDGLVERKSSGEHAEVWECAPGCPVAELDGQSGMLVSGANPQRRHSDKFTGIYGDFVGQANANPRRGVDRGGASRFFYCAKSSRAERTAGLSGRLVNDHPTVKPIGLLRPLVRLVTPPGGRVLDPFLGSGSIGCAAVLEGFDFVGVERQGRYLAIAEPRIGFWARQEGEDVGVVLAKIRRSGRKGDGKVPS
jgi:DNA modification methylase